MKFIYKFYCFIHIMFVLITCIPQEDVLSFFTDAALRNADLGTGSVELEIENFMLGSNQISMLRSRSDINLGVLSINNSELFSFSVRNKGKSRIDYTLDIEIAWDDNLPEKGKIFIYPSGMNDQEIYDNIRYNNHDEAVIGANISDLKEVECSTGLKLGISETIDSSMLGTEYVNSTKNYSFKLFFYEDDEIINNFTEFNNKYLEVNIKAYADIVGGKTNWESVENRFFRTVSVINSNIPIIYEIDMPKTFFITQATDINLQDYVYAIDEKEGDISHKIEIITEPDYNNTKAGSYTITYLVKNSKGNPSVPLQINIIIWDFVKFATGNYHSIALTSHGKVYSWGRNVEGQLGIGVNSSNNPNPTLIDDLSDVIDVAVCKSSSFALTKDGTVYSWGHNGYGHLGDGLTKGKNKPEKIKQPEGVYFTQIFAGYDTAGAITADGDVYTWGYGGNGANGTGIAVDTNTIPTKISIENISMIGFSNNNGAALTKDGKIYVWGTNVYGQLGNGTSGSSTIQEPRLVAYFEENNIKLSQISVGMSCMAAVGTNGELYTWGQGYNGQLGSGLTSNLPLPQLINLPNMVKKVITKTSHTAVITNDNKLYLFGSGAFGKLGFGGTEGKLSPTLFDAVGDVIDVSLGPDTTLVFSNSHVLYGMGNGEYGSLGNGTIGNSDVPIAWSFVPPAPY